MLFSYIHRAGGEITEKHFTRLELTYMDVVLMEAEKEIEKYTIRKALFGNEEVNFLLKDIWLIGENGYRVGGFDKDKGCKIQVDFWIHNYQQFRKNSEKEQRQKMMDKVKITGWYFWGLGGFEEDKDLKVRFIAEQEEKKERELFGNILVATYNEGELLFVNKKLSEIYETERWLRKIK